MSAKGQVVQLFLPYMDFATACGEYEEAKARLLSSPHQRMTFSVGMVSFMLERKNVMASPLTLEQLSAINTDNEKFLTLKASFVPKCTCSAHDPRWCAHCSSMGDGIEQFVSAMPPMATHVDVLSAEVNRLNEEMAWIRRKINVPEDAQMFVGAPNTIAGALHVLSSNAHGYITYIKAFKCDDKEGEIARLTVERDAALAEVARLRGAIRDTIGAMATLAQNTEGDGA
jgi:hypothetical protein